MTKTESPQVRTDTSGLRRAALRPVLVLLAGFLIVSTAMLAVLGTTTVNGGSVDTAVWIRCWFVLASAIVLNLAAVFAARGSRASWIRLRIISPLVVVAVIVIVSIPGFLPDWVRIEQVVCGLLVLPVSILVNLARTRRLFRKTAAAPTA